VKNPGKYFYPEERQTCQTFSIEIGEWQCVQTQNHEHFLDDQIALEVLVRFGKGELKRGSCSGRCITRRSGSNNAGIIATRRYKPATNIHMREIMLIHTGPRVLSMQGRSCGREGRTPLQAGEFNR
jgi:hypothetical protein